ncbi:MAG: hypothetical protein EG825_13015 [Rhodocyclaceae bacterium]|nr:hypothetical protein [Rhodocyclaceae bacterium]
MTHLSSWLLLIATLPTRPAAPRMRLWRAARALGCATLRDGAWLLPAGTIHENTLTQLATEASASGGTADVLTVQSRDAAQQERFLALFDRGADYARLLASIGHAQPSNLKALRGLRRDFNAIATADFFPGPAKAQAEGALLALEALASGEPSPADRAIPRLDRKAYRGRLWATRQGLWVDRLASAWLILRFIDAEARFRWLKRPEDCPARALGFDFDGAAFTHVGHRVTFETLLASFGLEDDTALTRFAALVHVLDAGGAPVPEAPGVEAVLAGLKARAPDDDQLLEAACAVFDSLYDTFRSGATP